MGEPSCFAACTSVSLYHDARQYVEGSFFLSSLSEEMSHLSIPVHFVTTLLLNALGV